MKKHGPYYWLDLRINGKRIRRSHKTGEHGLAVERARDIKNQLLAKVTMNYVTIHDFSLAGTTSRRRCSSGAWIS